MRISIRPILSIALVLALTACATPQAKFDYSEFRKNKPTSILVLPPVNNTPDVGASNGVLSTVTYPLAEAGYYVLPVAAVSETFKLNGLTDPAEIQQVDAAKLRQIFGADAALYISVKQYGSVYHVIGSEARVTASAKLVDLRTGQELWHGSATASSDEGNNNSGGGLIGALVGAALKQILNNVNDASQKVGAVTNQRLLGAGQPNGLLYGPRSPKFGTD
jgi:hypothetical protein